MLDALWDRVSPGGFVHLATTDTGRGAARRRRVPPGWGSQRTHPDRRDRSLPAEARLTRGRRSRCPTPKAAAGSPPGSGTTLAPPVPARADERDPADMPVMLDSFRCGTPAPPLFDGRSGYLTCEFTPTRTPAAGRPVGLTPSGSADRIEVHARTVHRNVRANRRSADPSTRYRVRPYRRQHLRQHPGRLCRSSCSLGWPPAERSSSMTTTGCATAGGPDARKSVLEPGPFAPLAVLMTVRILIEDGITPAIRALTASVYLTVSRVPAAADPGRSGPSSPLQRVRPAGGSLGSRGNRPGGCPAGVELAWRSTATDDTPDGVRYLPTGVTSPWTISGSRTRLWHPLDLLRTARAGPGGRCVLHQDDYLAAGPPGGCRPQPSVWSRTRTRILAR